VIYLVAGVVTVKSPVIFRDVQFIQFSVVASDGGIPLLNITSLNSTIIINVNVLNSNSFTPSFSQVQQLFVIINEAIIKKRQLSLMLHL
jgi:hypothetical protein